jgi:hypothetical protein
VAPEDFHDFYVASASVAGALIGLLFVAISVRPERLKEDRETHAHRVRAEAALTSFVNALTVSLFALTPGDLLGGTAVAVALVGLLFVLGSLVSVGRVRGVHVTEYRDTVFLIGLLVVFVLQLISGVILAIHPHRTGAAHTIGVLVIVCFLIGISRSWELIGGTNLGLFHEVARVARRPSKDDPDDGATSDEREPTSDPQPDPWSGSG